MNLAPIDLNNCDLEPIHIPGKIQEHGFLLVIDQYNKIKFVSAACQEFTGLPASALLNKPFSAFEILLGGGYVPGTFGKMWPNLIQPINPILVTLHYKPYDLVSSLAGQYTLLEFEPRAVPPHANVQQLINQSIPEILGGEDLVSLLTYSAAQVKAIIGYDRVMIYRLHPTDMAKWLRRRRMRSWNPGWGCTTRLQTFPARPANYIS